MMQMNWDFAAAGPGNNPAKQIRAMIDPITQRPFDFGYYIFVGSIAAFLGFVGTHIVVHFYDHCRPRKDGEDEAGNRAAAKKVAVGMAITCALFWIYVCRMGREP